MAQRVFGARAALLCALYVASNWLDGPLQAAVLDGKVFQVHIFHMTTPEGPSAIISSPFNLTVGPGVELTNFGFQEFPPLPGLVDIDMGDTTVLITLVIDQPFAFQEVLRFVDATHTIPRFKSVTLNPASNWAGFTPNRLADGAEFFDVNLSELSGLKGQQILLDITAVPEPASAGLALAASLAAAGARRRWRRRSLGPK